MSSLIRIYDVHLINNNVQNNNANAEQIAEGMAGLAPRIRLTGGVVSADGGKTRFRDITWDRPYQNIPTVHASVTAREINDFNNNYGLNYTVEVINITKTGCRVVVRQEVNPNAFWVCFVSILVHGYVV